MPVSASSARTAARSLSVDEALQRILARVTQLDPTSMDLLDALGTALAEDIVADRDVPPFRNSAMDGYAVVGADVAEIPVVLRVVGDICGGRLPVATHRPRRGDAHHDRRADAGRCRHRRAGRGHR